MNSKKSIKRHSPEIPFKISEYIKKNFEEEFLVDINSIKGKDGKILYKVDVGHENTLYHLEFNSDGMLVKMETEPILELSDDNYTNPD